MSMELMGLLPKVVIHNSISLDGSLLGFDVDMEAHYRLAGKYGAKATLAGSNTALKGFELFGAPPPEEEGDLIRPVGREHLPFIVIPDSTGKLKGMLHGIRRTEYFRDVIVLLSESTPPEYISYLKDRDYIHHVLGEEKVDLERALHLLHDEYGAGTVLVDTGSILGNLLIEKGLVSEISLLIHPVMVGWNGYQMFGPELTSRKMELLRSEMLGKGLVWTVYSMNGGGQ